MVLLCVFIVALLVTAVALVIRCIACLPIRARKRGLHTETEDASAAEFKASSAAQRRGHGLNSTFVTAVVLGSGGHTSEMLQLLQVMLHRL
jgi:Oligosaccharide biosynthesis protein Alg14 like